MNASYTPNETLLRNYAKILVQYALNNGKGMNKGETVYLIGQECSGPLYRLVAEEIWRNGGNVLTRYLPDTIQRYGLNRTLLEVGSDEQLEFFSKDYWQGVATAADHLLFILSNPDVHALEGIDPARIAKHNSSVSPFMEMRAERERLGKQSWTLCLYGTESAATEAGMTLEEYWKQIIDACYLEDPDPVAKWRSVQAEISEIKEKLTSLSIKSVHVQGEDADLTVLIGEHRKWLGGSGRNIPSYEIFISPDWRGTNGWIRFNQALYYSGTRISGIELTFKDGLVTKATAAENESTLLQMIAQENANKVGEFSLTDADHSRITKFMANTLYDENTGGAFGNTHIALGAAYKDAFDGNISDPTPPEWLAMGFNHCPKVHTDIISTTNRTVTATLADGTEKVIYKDGHFTLD